jgi:hypothetical protein
MVVLKPGARVHVPYWSKKASPHVAIHSWHEWTNAALEATVSDFQHQAQQVADQQAQILELGGEVELGVL